MYSANTKYNYLLSTMIWYEQNLHAFTQHGVFPRTPKTKKKHTQKPSELSGLRPWPRVYNTPGEAILITLQESSQPPWGRGYVSFQEVIYLIGFIRPFQCLKETRKKTRYNGKTVGTNQPGTDHLQLLALFGGFHLWKPPALASSVLTSMPIGQSVHHF